MGSRSSDVPRVLVLVPTYNEVENLATIVARLRSAVPHASVMILDDASPDGTGALADRLAAQDAAVRVLHRASKKGLGAAYIDGFRRGLTEGYDVLVEIDADGSHPAERLPALLDRLAEDDVSLVIGSRWIPGGRVDNWSRRRISLSRAANLYTRLALGMPVRDATAGFRAYAAAALAEIDLSAVRSRGYGFQIDMTQRLVRAGRGVAEVPITFSEREHGTSKMSGGIALEALVLVTGWGMRRAAGWRPLRATRRPVGSLTKR